MICLIITVNNLHTLSVLIAQVISVPMGNKVRSSDCTCLFSSGRKRAMKNASFIPLFYHEWSVVKTSHENLWLGCFLMCLAVSDCLLTSKYSLTRTSRLRAVSLMYVWPQTEEKKTLTTSWTPLLTSFDTE